MNPKSTRLHYLRGMWGKEDPVGAPFLSPLHTSVSRPAVPAKLPYAPSFWTQTYLRKCYANASKYNFPHLLKFQITWMARQADGSHLAQGSDPMPSGTSGRGRKRLRMESKVTIGEGKAAFPPGGAEAARRAEGTCRGRFLPFPVPPSRPAPHPHSWPASAANCASLRGFLRRVPPWGCTSLCGSRPRRVQKDARGGAGPSPAARPTGKVSTRRRGPGRAEGEARRALTLTLQARRPRQELKPRADGARPWAGASRRGCWEPGARDRPPSERSEPAWCR